MKNQSKSILVIGIDFGTQSARSQLIEVSSGNILCESVVPYQHNAMTQLLPDGTPLSDGEWALVHPQDYWDALIQMVHDLLKNSQVERSQIKGLSIAATASTLLPVNNELTPLCCLESFAHEPHAYAKLWKHHRAEPDARRMTQIAARRGEPFLASYGGVISSEWVMPKILEIMREAPEIYEATDAFFQISDWLDSKLTGQIIRSGGISSFKALYSRNIGYPSNEYLAEVHPKLPEAVRHKLRGRMVFPGEKAGTLTQQSSRLLGLLPTTVVASGHTDAHAAALGAGIQQSGDYLVVIGTSSVTHFVHHEYKSIKGVNACIQDGLLPGLTCYTAGQACVGDMFDWFIKLIDPEKKAETYAALEKEAFLKKAGNNNLVALDWWNGNRCLLGNNNLKGLMMGMTLKTDRADIYRALIESVAFGQRMIRDQYELNGLVPKRIVLCGGIATKSPLMCQIMANVLNTPIKVSPIQQATALGAGMCAATGIGTEVGGYECLEDAVLHMRNQSTRKVTPYPCEAAIYNEMFKKYRCLHDYFGIENVGLMESHI